MTSIGSEAQWNAAFTENTAPAAGTYTLTASFTFTAAPNKPLLTAGRELQGAGYVITIDAAVSTNYVGLVHMDGGTVINLGVLLNNNGIAANGGGIATGYGIATGRAGGTIQNSYVRAPASTSLVNSNTGGIVGRNYNASSTLTVYRCYVAMTVSGNSLGGIIGPDADGTINIDTCYVRGSPGIFPFFLVTGSNSQAACFVGPSSSGSIDITDSYGIGASLNTDIPSGSGTQNECAGFFAAVNAGETHTISSSYVSGVYLLSDNNGAIQVDDGFYTGTVTCTDVLYYTSGSANGADATQPSGTANLDTYDGAGTNLPSGWGAVWLRSGSTPYLGGTLGFSEAPWDPADYTGPGLNESLATLEEGACVLRGTLIRTPDGDFPIEILCEGDSVITGDGRIVKIQRINHWSMITKNVRHFPRRIPAHYFGKDMPMADLYIHQDHAFQVNGKWVHVNHHIPSFERMMNMMGAEYFHLQLEDYTNDTYIANGLTVEGWDGRTPIEFKQENLKFSWSCDMPTSRRMNYCERKNLMV